jgi:hypothetical protein
MRRALDLDGADVGPERLSVKEVTERKRMTTPSVPARAALGRYVVEGELGRGAMGVVYRARDPRIDRVVALKALAIPPGADGDTAEHLKQRFLNEARAAGRLHHPGIVTVFDADEDPATGTAYMAMELVAGQELKALMASGLPPARLLAILADVAAALDHAHERGVIHRDVKPANILVTPEGRAKLTDFGIARLGAQTLTQDGQFLGSPAYMAPEQVRGHAVSKAADIHALGVIVYEGLTGRRPYGGPDLVSTTHAITHDEPQRPSEIVRTLPAAVDEALGRALAKDPARRHPSASELVREVALAFAGSAALEPTAALPAGASIARTGPPGGAAARRARWMAAGAVVLVALAVLVGLDVRRRLMTPHDGGPAGTVETPGPPPEATVPPTPAPTPRSTPPAARQARLEIDLYTFHPGTLTVRDGEREIGRAETADLRRKGFKLKNPKLHRRAELPIAAGTRTLTFTFVPDDRRPLSRTATRDVAPGGVLKAIVDIGTLGRDMDLRWE